MDQQQLNANIERDIRVLIGDLQMQVIALRNMVNMMQGEKPKPGQPEPPRPPHPSPPDPPQPAAYNGGSGP